MNVILIAIENSRFVRGNLFSNKYLPFYPRAFTTLKGILSLFTVKLLIKIVIYQNDPRGGVIAKKGKLGKPKKGEHAALSAFHLPYLPQFCKSEMTGSQLIKGCRSNGTSTPIGIILNSPNKDRLRLPDPK